MLTCENIKKTYIDGERKVDVLKNINLSVASGQRVAIIGESGSGKSTLLNVLGGLDKPSAGTVSISGKPFSTLHDSERGKIRNASLGFVYQFHHLLPEFSAEENVCMPLLIGGVAKKEARARAKHLLQRVGLGHRIEHKPGALSGGERQRVAIARALSMSPTCVLLDEPTGNLDRQNAENIHQLISELSTDSQTAFVVVTHDEHLAQTLDIVYSLEDGVLNVCSRV